MSADDPLVEVRAQVLVSLPNLGQRHKRQAILAAAERAVAKAKLEGSRETERLFSDDSIDPIEAHAQLEALREQYQKEAGDE